MIACARAPVLTLVLLLVWTAAAADTVTVTLDNVTVDACDTEWTESPCVMQVVDTVEGDHTPAGSCDWDPLADGVNLLGARLEIDATALSGVEEVQIDLRESSGNGHTRVYLYDSGGGIIQFVVSNYSGSPTDQSLPIFIPGSELARIVVSGTDAVIQEVRLIGNLIVNTEKTSWGVIKSRW